MMTPQHIAELDAIRDEIKKLIKRADAIGEALLPIFSTWRRSGRRTGRRVPTRRGSSTRADAFFRSRSAPAP
jgi:hypothetical protein